MAMQKLAYKYWVVIISTLVLFLDRLDSNIVNVTFPTLAKYFHIPIANTSAINTSFVLALAISIPISQWLGDRFGLKRVFILTTALFGLASFSCAFSPNFDTMIGLRFLQGFVGGLIIPIGMTMVYRNFDHKEYPSILSYMFMPTLIAPAIAPALGGAFIEWLSWKWVFIFSAPVCLFAVILALLKLREEKTTDKEPLDWRGFILISSGLSLLLYALSLAKNVNAELYPLYYGLLAILLITLFIWHEKQTTYPLIDLYFFRKKLFIQANLIQLTFQVCHYSSFFLISIYLQLGARMSALETGAIIGMQALGALFISRYSVKLFHRHGPGVPIIIGLIGVALISVSILYIRSPEQFFVGGFLLFLRGIFTGLCGVPIQMLSVIAFNKEQAGKASAIFNITRQIAISVGIALFSLLIAYNSPSANDITSLNYHDFYLSFLLIPVMAILGIIITLTIDNNYHRNI